MVKSLKSYLDTIFLKRKFKKILIKDLDITVWKNNKNVVVALIDLSDSNIENIGKYAQQIKIDIGKEMGYKPLTNTLRMQLIFIGDNLKESKDIKNYVDKINNQKVVLQSIHIVDKTNKLSKSVKTWGQFFTGKYQDMIEVVIDLYLENLKDK
ncbi:MAG: hypothetical protein FH751_03155 [Firmicutes bacterium]|nr:hypothetical protein [Bacillota bacterium]